MADWGLKFNPQLAGLFYLQCVKNDCDFIYMDWLKRGLQFQYLSYLTWAENMGGLIV